MRQGKLVAFREQGKSWKDEQARISCMPLGLEPSRLCLNIFPSCFFLLSPLLLALFLKLVLTSSGLHRLVEGLMFLPQTACLSPPLFISTATNRP